MKIKPGVTNSYRDLHGKWTQTSCAGHNFPHLRQKTWEEQFSEINCFVLSKSQMRTSHSWFMKATQTLAQSQPARLSECLSRVAVLKQWSFIWGFILPWPVISLSTLPTRREEQLKLEETSFLPLYDHESVACIPSLLNPTSLDLARKSCAIHTLTAAYTHTSQASVCIWRRTGEFVLGLGRLAYHHTFPVYLFSCQFHYFLFIYGWLVFPWGHVPNSIPLLVGEPLLVPFPCYDK